MLQLPPHAPRRALTLDRLDVQEDLLSRTSVEREHVHLPRLRDLARAFRRLAGRHHVLQLDHERAGRRRRRRRLDHRGRRLLGRGRRIDRGGRRARSASACSRCRHRRASRIRSTPCQDDAEHDGGRRYCGHDRDQRDRAAPSPRSRRHGLFGRGRSREGRARRHGRRVVSGRPAFGRRRRPLAERVPCRAHELTAAREAVRRRLGERPGDHVVELRRQIRTLRVRRGRRLEQVRGDRGGIRSLLERPQSGQALVENAPERVDVRPGVDRLPFELLRRRVVDRPDEGAGLREPALRTDLLGDPEVAEVRVLVLLPGSDEDVRGLDIAMHETVGVDGVERLRDLREDVESTPDREPTRPPEQRPEVGAVDVAHRDVEAVLGLSRLVDGHDARMLDPRRRTPLLLEPLAELPVMAELRSKHLQRDLAAVAQLLGAVDDSHAAPADDALDAESGQLGSDPGLGIRAHRRHLLRAGTVRTVRLFAERAARPNRGRGRAGRGGRARAR